MKSMVVRHKWAVGLAVVAISASVAMARAQVKPRPTHVVVPSEIYRTIQQGIGAVAPGGTVRIEPGVYVENLTVVGKSVNIVGSGARVTEIRSNVRELPVITFGGDGGGTVKDLSLRDGASGIFGRKKGGLFPAALEVEDIVIHGGQRGVFGSFSSLKLNDGEIFDTSWHGISITEGLAQMTVLNFFVHSVGGVGIYCGEGTFQKIADCTVSSNFTGGIVITGPSYVEIQGCTVDLNAGFGILVINNAAALIQDTKVSRTFPRVDDGAFGDGIMAAVAKVAVLDCIVKESKRVGISSFGGSVSLGNTKIECNTIDLNSEPFLGKPAVFDDLGGNVCGCGGAVIACQVKSLVLEPPGPTDP